MDNLSVTDIHGYVIDGAFAVGVKDQVARAHLAGFNAPVRSLPALWKFWEDRHLQHGLERI